MIAEITPAAILDRNCPQQPAASTMRPVVVVAAPACPSMNAKITRVAIRGYILEKGRPKSLPAIFAGKRNPWRRMA